MQQIIPVINELHDAFAGIKVDAKLNLPQIAVVGSQSSGKSSVLETIVGRDFLPRGSGIVTRCPLVLQLVQLPPNSEEYAEFLHKGNKKYTDFLEVRKEIENQTLSICGAAGIIAVPINLRIFSPHVLTLTLVDLPGLVMNAVAGQPKDIEKQIKDMVKQYVAPTNTIILAITPANADIATSSALKMAREVDPEGVRTLGVLTKLDLMDRGTDAMDMLSGKLINLRKGFIGVVNRSQQDINENKDIVASRLAERLFFENHPQYSRIAEMQGTEYLSITLNKLLLENIQATLPELKDKVDKLLNHARKEMEKLGMFDQNANEPGAQLLQLINMFNSTVLQTIDGTNTDLQKELVGGARLRYIFDSHFGVHINGMSAAKFLTDEIINVQLMNISGMSAALFPSDKVFSSLAKQQVGRLEDPCVKCVQLIHDELLSIAQESSSKAERYPILQKRMIEITRQLLLSYKQPAVDHVRTTIAAEKAYVNLKHPELQLLNANSLKNMAAAQYNLTTAAPGASPQQPTNPNAPQQRPAAPPAPAPPRAEPPATLADVPLRLVPSSTLSEHDKATCIAIREMVQGYFGIIQRTVVDQVPKIISLLLIQKIRDSLYAVLVRELYKQDQYEMLLAESPDIVAKRRSLLKMNECLVKAHAALEKVKDLHINQ